MLIFSRYVYYVHHSLNKQTLRTAEAEGNVVNGQTEAKNQNFTLNISFHQEPKEELDLQSPNN